MPNRSIQISGGAEPRLTSGGAAEMDGVKFLGRQLIFKKGFASKVMRRTWIQVSTTCGSGWVDVFEFSLVRSYYFGF